MLQIIGQSKRLNIVIDSSAAEFRPLIMCGTTMYDPFNQLKPVGSPRGIQKLHSSFHDEARELFASAKQQWQPCHSTIAAQPATPASALDSLIAQSVASISVNDVINNAKPAIDKYIAETYGILPKRLEVKSAMGNHIVKGITHEKFETVLKMVNLDIPVFLTGPAGSGKNVICKQVSEALGLEFYFSNAVTQEYKLTGFIDANGHYQETQFYKAFTNGGLFMLDEMDASTPEALVILNAAIANRYFDFPTGKAAAHENFRVIAAGNTYGTGADIEYTGRYQLDAASLDRFAVVEINYSAAVEEAIAGGNTELVQFIHDFRAAVEMAKIKFVVSYRSVERLHKLEQVFDKAEAIQIALIKGLDKEDAKMVSNNLSGNTPYEKALHEAVAA